LYDQTYSEQKEVDLCRPTQELKVNANGNEVEAKTSRMNLREWKDKVESRIKAKMA
jgi:hypothetical protein